MAKEVYFGEIVKSIHRETNSREQISVPRVEMVTR